MRERRDLAEWNEVAVHFDADHLVFSKKYASCGCRTKDPLFNPKDKKSGPMCKLCWIQKEGPQQD